MNRTQTSIIMDKYQALPQYRRVMLEKSFPFAFSLDTRVTSKAQTIRTLPGSPPSKNLAPDHPNHRIHNKKGEENVCTMYLYSHTYRTADLANNKRNFYKTRARNPRRCDFGLCCSSGSSSSICKWSLSLLTPVRIDLAGESKESPAGCACTPPGTPMA